MLKSVEGIDYIPVDFLDHAAWLLVINETGRVPANYWNYRPKSTIARYRNYDNDDDNNHIKIINPYSQEDLITCQKWVARMRLIYPDFDCEIGKVISRGERI